MSDPEKSLSLHTEEPNDEIMEDSSSKRELSPGNAADPPQKPRLDWADNLLELEPNDHFMDQIMEDSFSKRAQRSPKNAANPPKRPRLLQLEWISPDHPQAQITTLVKAVNYGRIEQLRYDSDDEEEKVNMFIQQMEENKCVRLPNNIWSGTYTDADIDRFRISGCTPGPNPISAGPVLEVISVSVYKKNKNDSDHPTTWEDFGMYGNIALKDYLGNTYFVYHCEQEYPEHVFEDREIALAVCPIAPVMGSKVKFSLTDADDSDIQIFKDVDHYLEDSLECGKQVTQCFNGENDYVARMVYKKTPLAVSIELEFFLLLPLGLNSINQEGTTHTVSGVIKVNDIVCWECSDGVNMTYGKACGFGQSRYVFAVPIGTLVDIYISWKSSSGITFVQSFKLEPMYFFTPAMRYPIPGSNENCVFWYEMGAGSHYDFFHIMGGHLVMEWNPKIPQIYPNASEVSPKDALVEVFSVLLYGGGDFPVAPLLWGQIVVRDQQGKFYIFARNKDWPDKCLSNEHRFKRTLSLAWPDDKWILGTEFYMYLRLKDVNGNPVCKGNLQLPRVHMKFDRRLCNVIVGENGYFAAVHYSVFLNGKKAKVSVKCRNKGLDPYCLVYGSIFAEYDNYDDYHSTYDKECYRIIIFKRIEEECLKVESGSKIPLSKSHISAPSNCESLSVYVDMCVCPCTGRSYELAVGKLVLEAGIDQFRSCGKHVAVGIEWFS